MLSEIEKLIDDDGYAASFQSMGHYRTALLIALRAQTNAQPVALSEAAKAIHYPECWDTAAYPTLADALSEVYAHFCCTNQDTHPAPEAAQAGLQEALRDLVDAVSAEVDESWTCNSYHPAFFPAVKAARAILNLSAATVAEPSAIDPGECAKDVFEHGYSVGYFDIPKEAANLGCALASSLTGDRFDWHYFAGRVHIKVLKAAQQQPKPTELTSEACAKPTEQQAAHDVTDHSDDALEMVEQQAEPVGDEPSIVRAGLIGLAKHVRAVPAYNKLLGDMESVDKAIVLLAAQSGQRAGVAEGWKLVPRRITDEMHIASGMVKDAPFRIWEAMYDAAPTQQKERGE